MPEISFSEDKGIPEEKLNNLFTKVGWRINELLNLLLSMLASNSSPVRMGENLLV